MPTLEETLGWSQQPLRDQRCRLQTRQHLALSPDHNCELSHPLLMTVHLCLYSISQVCFTLSKGFHYTPIYKWGCLWACAATKQEIPNKDYGYSSQSVLYYEKIITIKN